MVKELYLAWQNNKREWTPVGRLKFDDGKYYFHYTKGISKLTNFIPFGRMKDLDNTYESNELFPIFQNRLLPKTRPEYVEYLTWLNLEENKFSKLDELARAGGIRATDSLQLFAKPVKINDCYEVSFFSHGIRHLAPGYIERIQHLNHGNEIFLMKDIQNKYDDLALALRTDDPPEIIGYCPRFYVYDFNKLLEMNTPANVNVRVEKINHNCPNQFKLLCSLKTKWPNTFSPFEHETFKPFAN